MSTGLFPPSPHPGLGVNAPLLLPPRVPGAAGLPRRALERGSGLQGRRFCGPGRLSMCVRPLEKGGLRGVGTAAGPRGRPGPWAKAGPARLDSPAPEARTRPAVTMAARTMHCAAPCQTCHPHILSTTLFHLMLRPRADCTRLKWQVVGEGPSFQCWFVLYLEAAKVQVSECGLGGLDTARNGSVGEGPSPSLRTRIGSPPPLARAHLTPRLLLLPIRRRGCKLKGTWD